VCPSSVARLTPAVRPVLGRRSAAPGISSDSGTHSLRPWAQGPCRALAGARDVLTAVGCRCARIHFLLGISPTQEVRRHEVLRLRNAGPMHAVRAYVRRLTATSRVPRPDVCSHLLHGAPALAQGARPQECGRERHSVQNSAACDEHDHSSDVSPILGAARSPSVPASSPRVAVEGVMVTFSLARRWQNQRSTPATATAG